MRDCREILDELIDRLLAQIIRRRRAPLRLDRSCRQRLRSYGFPGNIRELQNLLEHFAVVCEGVVREQDVVGALSHSKAPAAKAAAAPIDERVDGEPLARSVRRYESRLIQDAIARAGSKRAAARLLGVNIATIVRKSLNRDA